MFRLFQQFLRPLPHRGQAVLREAGVPYLQGLRESVKAIKALIAYHLDAPSVPPGPTRIDEARGSRRGEARAFLASCGPVVTEDKAKQLIARYGLPVVSEQLARDPVEAGRAAARLGYPAAAKIVSPDIAHKAKVGGALLGLKTSSEVEDALTSILTAISAARPAARIEGVLVQPMVDGGIETILGLKRDPQFGMTIVFGLGGVLIKALSPCGWCPSVRPMPAI
jgi:acyl-CoA synthetase (NDP forming)